MMRRLALILVIFISACSYQPEKTYYQLPVVTIASQKSATVQHDRQLWVQRVMLSDYLSSSGVVYQSSDVSYVSAVNHLWASPLEQQLQQVLVAELTIALPQRLVSAQPLVNKPDTLDVTVTSFHGRYDGKVVLQGYWTLTYEGSVVKQPFNIELKQEEDGYDDLVRTLATGWSQLAQTIANQLISRS
ncbi:membrane integrity-associated transporter subunit PqiC [Photorhabdus luminescens]|uniref:Membrane integrity-associated transporter subunit PqiC n=1 Tax=Photorhabdus luminescens subsp. sonorensis TaxID=1173677 RepID=A0A5C4RD58_PHOLU|nr:membrane integrity-associated transporter subunit PqiC [Photorhabdus luminescens]TNH41983.1 membrane integrity-associated transporter subunit PqiC [Photorhabdus luminescens subsp. sonorensis]